MDGERFKLIRRMLLLSQAELAIKLGVSQPTITNWERGYKSIPVEIAGEMDKLKKNIQEVV